MQTVANPTAWQDALDTGSVDAVHKLFIEFNHNRTRTATVTADSVDEVYFPSESVVKPNRPQSGLPKLLSGDGKAAAPLRGTTKYRAVSRNSQYKYWASREISGSGGTMASPPIVQVDYDASVTANKIVVKFEVSDTTPTSFNVETLSGSWSNAFTGTNSDLTNGELILYYQSGAWVKDASAFDEITRESGDVIDGVRVKINTMDAQGKRAQVIEVSARMEDDISADVIQMNIDETRELQDLALPTGYMVASLLSVDLSNVDNKYNKYSGGSRYFGMLEKYVQLHPYLGIVDDTSTAVYLPMGKFYVTNWSQEIQEPQITVDAEDYSVFLRETKAPNMLLQPGTVENNSKVFVGVLPFSYAVEEVLARVGFNNVNFNTSSDTEYSVPIFWSSDDSSVWEVMTDIARAEQACFYFDRDGVLQWDSKSFLFADATVDLNLDASTNLISANPDFTVMANKITVRFKELEAAPIRDVVWEDTAKSVLITSPLASQLNAGATQIVITAADWPFFPREGFVQVEDEIIKYNDTLIYDVGAATDKNLEEVISDVGVENLLASIANPSLYNNPRLIVEARGQFNTDDVVHKLDDSRWTVIQKGTVTPNTTGNGIVGGGYELKQFSTSSRADSYWRFAYQNEYAGAIPNVMSTRIRFPQPVNPDTAGLWHTMGGLAYNVNTSTGAGYYVEIVGNYYKERYRSGLIGNVRVYKMDGSFNRTGLPQTENGIRGANFPVYVGNAANWIDISVSYDAAQDNHSIYVNGQFITSFTDSTYTTGKFGMFVRGRTTAEFEHFTFYGGIPYDHIDNSKYPNGGYSVAPDGPQFFFATTKYQNTHVVEEFNPRAKLIREFNAEYTKYPALYSQVRYGNIWQVKSKLLDWSPFNANFLMSNRQQSNSVLIGNASVNNDVIPVRLYITGLTAVVGREEKIERQNDASIRKDGEVAVEINSPWILREDQALEIADYITSRWATNRESVSAGWFPDVRLELGDTVDINYPAKDMVPGNGLYHVIGLNYTYDGGISSNLTLRRVV